MTSSGAADEWDLVVPDTDAEFLAELRRHGVRPGQHLHLKVVPGSGPAGAVTLADLDERPSAGAERPQFRSTEGLLAHLGAAPSMEDFEDASRLAIAEAEAGPTIPE
jgi:hypothetical protein